MVENIQVCSVVIIIDTCMCVYVLMFCHCGTICRTRLLHELLTDSQERTDIEQVHIYNNITIVSRVSAHGHLNITRDFGPHGRLPGIKIPYVCIEAATVTP